MSASEPARVSVRILEKEYFVACPHEERAALLDAAEFLNGRIERAFGCKGADMQFVKNLSWKKNTFP